MDEFGRPEALEQSMDQDEKMVNGTSPIQPHRNPPSPSPAPFSHYTPTSAKVAVHGTGAQQPQPQPLEADDNGAGCCKCVIM